jgi:hypothetical protein
MLGRYFGTWETSNLDQFALMIFRMRRAVGG